MTVEEVTVYHRWRQRRIFRSQTLGRSNWPRMWSSQRHNINNWPNIHSCVESHGYLCTPLYVDKVSVRSFWIGDCRTEECCAGGPGDWQRPSNEIVRPFSGVFSTDVFTECHCDRPISTRCGHPIDKSSIIYIMSNINFDHLRGQLMSFRICVVHCLNRIQYKLL